MFGNSICISSANHTNSSYPRHLCFCLCRRWVSLFRSRTFQFLPLYTCLFHCIRWCNTSLRIYSMASCASSEHCFLPGPFSIVARLSWPDDRFPGKLRFSCFRNCLGRRLRQHFLLRRHSKFTVIALIWLPEAPIFFFLYFESYSHHSKLVHKSIQILISCVIHFC